MTRSQSQLSPQQRAEQYAQARTERQHKRPECPRCVLAPFDGRDHELCRRCRLDLGLEPELPPSECKAGYPRRQIEQIMGTRITQFDQWMRGQTAPFCDGKGWGCTGSHGACVYESDVRNFLNGGDPFD